MVIINYGKKYKIMKILKVYFYTELEIKYLILNLLESYDYIDKLLILEYNTTHTGDKKDYIWEDYKHLFPEDKMDKVEYHTIDLSHIIKKTDNEDIIHKVNERYMRGYFTKLIDLKDDDIVVSVDADEIIYGEMYPKLFDYVEKNGFCTLKMHQFFYRYDYLWYDSEWIAPIISKYKYHKNDFPSNWRYGGNVTEDFVGCHFSWCMNVDDMIYKLNHYSHSPTYKRFADKELLENAIKNKIYPFDLKKKFNIKVLNDEEKVKYLPKNFEKINLFND